MHPRRTTRATSRLTILVMAFGVSAVSAQTSRVSRVDEGRRLEATGDLEGARELYRKAAVENPQDAEPLARLARVSLYLKDYDRAYEILKVLRRDHPDHALGTAVLGLYQFCLRQSEKALETVDRAMGLDARTREAYLIKADILFALRDMRAAQEVLQRFLEIFPGDAEGLYLQGIVAFYERDLPRARGLLEASARRNPSAFNVRKDLVQVYALTGNPKKALEVLGGLIRNRPDDPSLKTLQSGLKERLSLETKGLRRQVGPFALHYPGDIGNLPLATILRLLREAYDGIGERRDSRPERVQVTILDRTDQALPAYYNHVSDEITLSREYFEHLDTPQKEELGRHLIFHEYSHLAFYHDIQTPLPPAALWVIEGLAEFEAGGYTYTPVDYSSMFVDGLYDLEALEEALPVSAIGRGMDRELAYVQSHAMISYLYESMGEQRAAALVKELAFGYTRHGPDHERVMTEVLGVPPAEFLARVGEFIRDRWIRSAAD